MSAAHSTNASRPGWMRRVARGLLVTRLILLVTGMTGWGTLFLWLSNLPGEPLRIVLAALFAIGTGASFVLFKKRWRTLLVYLGVFATLVLWFFALPPSNHRLWAPEVAVLASATVQGHLVEIKNIRNFDYRTATDFTPRYYDKTFDLNKLDTLDLIATYWMGDAIAHMMVSFGFSGQDYLTVSIETRKEIGESYSTLAGFFREYELYYVVADERDLIRVRTNYRKDPPEDVYLYRIKGPVENARRIFLSYIAEINSLKDHPEFYNTLTTNCTTNIWMHSKVNKESPPLNWKILVSGYVPQFLYEIGRLDTRLPFDELRRRSHVNAAAHAANDVPDFSQRIRANVPMPPRGAQAER